MIRAPWMPLHRLDVDALEQPVQLLNAQRRYRRMAWPGKPILLQAFEQQPEAVAILTCPQ
ncbi:hypothetical protein BC350_04700 [Ralstonia pseudosolanacearum]|nr:hypothetical protein BC350_04700 [Ralstonia pseudosolanacearum]